MNYITLNNGIKIPQLGLGTFMLSPDEAQHSTTFALNHGYELIDTANAYVNEKGVGRGMKASQRKREEIFLETKLWPCFYKDETAIDQTLERLGTDYIDLMILHQPAGDYLSGYKQLEKAYKEGKLKSIGISNFNEDEIMNLLEHCEIIPSLIQVEAHPYYPQTELLKSLKKHNIALQAWYPLGGRGNQSIMNEPVIKKIAQKHQKTTAQVILRWHIQKGFVVIPGSKSEAHILDNIDIFDFELSNEDMKEIASLEKSTTIYHRTDEQLQQFALWHPDVEHQK